MPSFFSYFVREEGCAVPRVLVKVLHKCLSNVKYQDYEDTYRILSSS